MGFKNIREVRGLIYFGSEWKCVVVSCELSIEPSCFMKDGKFLQLLSSY